MSTVEKQGVAAVIVDAQTKTSDGGDGGEGGEEVDLIKMTSDTEVSLYGGLGHVRLVDMMPRIVSKGRTADLAIVQAARTSFQQAEKTIKEDENLIKYLMEHAHTSPFEMVVFKFHMEIPIFVERQLVRHRTASLNEASYRYSTAPDKTFLPTLRLQDDVNKQASKEGKVPEEANRLWTESQVLVHQLFENYHKLLAMGCAREVARCILPQSLMTTLVWEMNLRNLLHFLSLRDSPHAQKEIMELAQGIMTLIRPRVPATCAAHDNYVRNAIHLSVDEQLAMSGKKKLDNKRDKALTTKRQKLC